MISRSKSRKLTISRALSVLAAALASATAPPITHAAAANYDGSWSMLAETTRGHCGAISVGLAIRGGRISATGGSFAFHPIRIAGRVAPSGAAQMRAITGPRTAAGNGRFKGAEATGTWAGRGPSGLCSGVWRATRS